VLAMGSTAAVGMPAIVAVMVAVEYHRLCPGPSLILSLIRLRSEPFGAHQ
jgi:hypothetical protein